MFTVLWSASRGSKSTILFQGRIQGFTATTPIGEAFLLNSVNIQKSEAIELSKFPYLQVGAPELQVDTISEIYGSSTGVCN